MSYISSFNFIDVFVIVFLTAWMVHGYTHGFLLSLFSLLAFLVSIYLATKAYPYLSMLLNNSYGLSRSYSNLISFIVLFGVFNLFLGALSIRYLYRRIIKFIIDVHLNLTDKILGSVLAMLVGVIWLAIILGIFTWFPMSMFIKDQIATSQIGAPMVKKASSIEPQMEKIAGQAIENTIGFATSKPKGHTWRPNIDSNARFKYDSEGELHMLSLVNQERKSRGLKPLVFDTRLRDVARSHSMDMVKNNYFDHHSPTAGSPFDRIRSAGIFFLAAGENIAYAQDIDIAHDNLMLSRSHRENILSPHYGRIGIGIVNADPYGYMITQDFIN